MENCASRAPVQEQGVGATNKGARVRFQISDVFLPSPEGLSESPTADLEGAIVDFSDSGSKRHAFVVVELDDGKTMIVPIEKVRPVSPSAHESGRQ